MGLSLGTAVLELVTESSGLNKGLDQAKEKAGGFGKFAVGALGLAAAGAVAVGAALLKIGSDFDSAADNIAIKTGATGAVLEGLKGDFQAVFGSVPTDMATASNAIAGLNQRLGLTGEPLQALATQFINLSRITGEQLNPLIEAGSRAFQSWGVETERQGAALDNVFKASQASGVPVQTLIDLTVQHGAVLRDYTGGDLDLAVTMLAKFEQEGLQTGNILTAMSIATKKLATETIGGTSNIGDLIDKIRTLGPGADSTKLAIEAFGKQGIVMGDAIHKGALDVDDLSLKLKANSTTINGTAASTDDWTQKLGVLSNKLTVALAPAADAVFNALGDLITWVTPYVEQLAIWVGDNLPGAMQAAGAALNELRPLFEVLGAVLGWIGEHILPLVGAAFQVVGGTIRNVISAVQTLIGWLRDAWSWVGRVIDAARSIPAVQGIANFVGSFAEGGSFIATRPTLAMFGEGGGPELVTATPLGRDVGISAGSGHGHPIVMDGRLVAQAVSTRQIRGAAAAGYRLG